MILDIKTGDYEPWHELQVAAYSRMAIGGPVVFEPATHTYTLGGRRLISVTQALSAAGLIDATWYTEEATLRGTYVHEATALYDTGQLDHDSLDPRIIGYITAWIAFRADTGFVPNGIEARGYHATHHYAGMVDRVSDTVLPGGGAWVVYLRADGRYKVRTVQTWSHWEAWLCALGVANWKLKHGETRERTDSTAGSSGD